MNGQLILRSIRRESLEYLDVQLKFSFIPQIQVKKVGANYS